jgi:hypothetical protein
MTANKTATTPAVENNTFRFGQVVDFISTWISRKNFFILEGFFILGAGAASRAGSLAFLIFAGVLSFPSVIKTLPP